MSFGIFETLTQYGVLGLAVLGLGYLCWHFLNKLMKSEDDYRTRLEELQDEVRTSIKQELKKSSSTIKENTESSKSLKEIIMALLSTKKD
jgi:hypothetical protein